LLFWQKVFDGVFMVEKRFITFVHLFFTSLFCSSFSRLCFAEGMKSENIFAEISQLTKSGIFSSFLRFKKMHKIFAQYKMYKDALAVKRSTYLKH
jgi:hypothetical protein